MLPFRSVIKPCVAQSFQLVLPRAPSTVLGRCSRVSLKGPEPLFLSTLHKPLRSATEQGRLLTTSAAMRPQRIAPGPGQESVWDYPRPPRVEKVPHRIRIVFNNEEIVNTGDAYRVLETSHPPVYYFPQKDVKMEYVSKSPGSSFCEWKGSATYWSLDVGGKQARNVGWSYESPTPTFQPIKSHIAFYCAPMDACYVGDEKATPQPGGFYGGWMTSNIVGPVKGGEGSWGW